MSLSSFFLPLGTNIFALRAGGNEHFYIEVGGGGQTFLHQGGGGKHFMFEAVYEEMNVS